MLPAGTAGHRHAELRLEHAVPGRADRRAGAAAAAGAAGVPAGARPRPSRRAATAVAAGTGDHERRGGGGRGGDLRDRGRHRGRRRARRCATCSADREKLCEAVTVGARRGGLILRGRGAEPEPVALGRRLRRALRRRPTAGAGLGGDAGGVGGAASGRLAADSPVGHELVLEDPLGSHK